MGPTSPGAYMFGELRWPMPDPGLIAVWRAMAIDPARWSDWQGFVGDGAARLAGTIAALVDAGAPADIPAELVIDEHGVKLRARVEAGHAAWGKQLAIAWRLAADLDARGELVWVAGDVAYRTRVGDGASTWEKITGAAAVALDPEPAPAPAATAPVAPAKKRASTAKPVPAEPKRTRRATPAPRKKPARAGKRKR